VFFPGIRIIGVDKDVGIHKYINAHAVPPARRRNRLPFDQKGKLFSSFALIRVIRGQLFFYLSLASYWF